MNLSDEVMEKLAKDCSEIFVDKDHESLMIGDLVLAWKKGFEYAFEQISLEMAKEKEKIQ